MRFAPLSLALGLCLGLCPGCHSDSQWTFAASRAIYESDALGKHDWSDLSEAEPEAAASMAVGAAILIALPLAIDLVLLPITLPHDLIVMRR